MVRPCTHAAAALLLMACLEACGPAAGGAPPRAGGGPDTDPGVIWADGSFEDWRGVEPLAVDGARDAPDGADVDLVAVRGQADDRFIHLLLDVGRVVTAQGLRGGIELLVDGDGDPATGITMDGLEGVDLVVVLSRPAGPESDFGAGVGVATAQDGALGDVGSSYPVGLLVSPTHASDRFEIRMTRGSDIGSRVRLAPGPGVVRGLVRHIRQGEVLDRLGPFDVSVPGEPARTLPQLGADALTPPDGTLRVVVWNVSDDVFREEAAAFQRVVGALAPDVLLLDEAYEEVTDGDLEAFVAGVPGGRPVRPWAWWIAQGGGPQRTVVALPRYPVRGEPSLARVPYPDSALAAWSGGAGGSEAVRGKAELERDAGLSATGAWVEVEGHRVLFVPVDLQSGGRAGSPLDELRVVQAGTLNRALAGVLADHPEAALVIGGDLNLVGSNRPLRALVRGLGGGGGDLTVARALNAPDRSLVTWRSLGAADNFSPGRLDYVLYRDSRLEVANAFVFDAAQLDEAALDAVGVAASDSRVTSDHLPVVVDFRVRR